MMSPDALHLLITIATLLIRQHATIAGNIPLLFVPRLNRFILTD